MRVDLFDYPFDPSLIAQRPLAERTRARLLVGSTPPVETTIAEFPALLPRGAVLVVNDTRVVPARLLGKRLPHGGKAEIFLLRRLSDGSHEALGKASKSLRPGSRIDCGPLQIEVAEKAEGALRVWVRLGPNDALATDEEVARALSEVGHMPLPPYISRLDDHADREQYQTVFAARPGAVAAPTAGLHMTPPLLATLRAQGVSVVAVTLHVGLGTFKPVIVDDLDAHPMHEETYEISDEASACIMHAKLERRPVVAVGTTVVRALESRAAEWSQPLLSDPLALATNGSASTRLLIQPGYTFRVVDQLLTNFHLPKSTLLALVCAFAGYAHVMSLYAHAVARRFRFFSYGDAMFLSRAGTEGASPPLASPPSPPIDP
jgi:S-adenosylmethionine:tRNA ribosyltransferase-isomerase